jgi:uncharacterized protein (TIGR03435 family)
MRLRALAAFVFAPGAICAQPQPAAPARPSFEVASVKPANLTFLQLSPHRSGGLLRWSTMLNLVIEYAYHLQTWQIAGYPSTSNDLFAFEATTSPDATDDQVRLMFQSLLADRFKLAVHRETKQQDGWALTLGKSGLKIKEAKDSDPPPPMPEWFGKFEAKALDGQVMATMEGKGVGALTGRRVSMAQLAASLQRVQRAFVHDETDVSGKYYFGIKFAPDNGPADPDLPPLMVAIQELGLRLEKRRGAVDVLVIDHVEKAPTEN